MSKLSTQPIVRCKHCGKYLKLVDLHTTVSDTDMSILMELAKAVMKDALCEDCQKQKNYLISQGRGDEWYQLP
jgi:hypothetical protein